MGEPEIYVSIDVESNGPIPGPNSMWSLGAAAFLDKDDFHSSFSVNLEDLPDSKGHPDTMAWWAKPEQAEAYAAARCNLLSPMVAMQTFYYWVCRLPGKPVCVAYPAGYDFMFTYWYLIRFVGRSPFSFSALDIKTYACAMMGTPYRKSTKRHMPKRWFSEAPHTHWAEDDAIEQGFLFMNMREENLKLINQKRRRAPW